MAIKKHLDYKENNLATIIKSISRLKPDKVLFCFTELQFLHSVTKYKKTGICFRSPVKLTSGSTNQLSKLNKGKAVLMSQIIRSRFLMRPRLRFWRGFKNPCQKYYAVSQNFVINKFINIY